jgi:MmyB-like transcription regulator ligand binding domain
MALDIEIENLPEETREFVREVEGLVIKRHEEARRKRSRERWLLTDLYDTVYPSYQSLRRGKVKHLPPRDTVMQIARHFRCTTQETNRLLAAARYAVEEPYLQGDELERVLLTAQSIINYLPLPAYAITRDLTIRRWNHYLPPLFGLDHNDLVKTPDEERNILRYAFDPQTPIYRLVSANYERWKYIASMSIFWFKSDNINCRYDQWYQQQKEDLMKYPAFEEIWESVDLDYRPPQELARRMDFPQHVLELSNPQGITVCVRGIQMKYHDKEYPRIVAYIPEIGDSKSREILTLLGIPTPDNGWGYK